MSESSDETEVVTGIAWYDKEDYERLRRISADSQELSDTWEEWREGARETMRKLVASGRRVEKVPIDLDELQAWCAKNLRPVDGEARSEFAAEKLRERNQASDSRAP
ncbi:MAG: hypothetical protein ABEL76_13890 [Bradymonadaceae bacterium]